MTVGSVSRLWRFPVKSMAGERLDESECTTRGLVGDRAYALIDAESGKVASAKSVRLFPELLNCRASFIEQPRSDGEAPPVRIDLPNGVSVTSDSSDADGVLTSFFRRAVKLAQAAPEDFTIDQYHPDVEDADPAGRRDTVVEQKLGSAFFDEVGMPSPVPVGSFFDLFPLTVLTTSTLSRLSELQPGSAFDERRFRMNLVIDSDDAGFVENDWVGRELAVGDLRLSVTLPDPRCVMTTLAQDDLPKDIEVLRTLVHHNRIQVGDVGRFPCAGVYAVVMETGVIRVGDRVSLS